MVQGGTQATAIKNAAREVLLGSLRAIANYVQGACNNDWECPWADYCNNGKCTT